MIDVSKFQRPARVVVKAERGEVVRRRNVRKVRGVVVKSGVVVEGPFVLNADRPIVRDGLVIVPARSPAAIGWHRVAGVVFEPPTEETPQP